MDPNKFWPAFTFTQPGFSKTCWVRFPQPCVTNIAIGFVSLGLENLKKDVPRFPWPSGPKQNLTCVDFPSSWFLKIYWCLFRSASRHQHIYIYIYTRGLRSFHFALSRASRSAGASRPMILILTSHHLKSRPRLFQATQVRTSREIILMAERSEAIVLRKTEEDRTKFCSVRWSVLASLSEYMFGFEVDKFSNKKKRPAVLIINGR